jgi:hypothetical protein
MDELFAKLLEAYPLPPGIDILPTNAPYPLLSFFDKCVFISHFEKEHILNSSFVFLDIVTPQPKYRVILKNRTEYNEFEHSTIKSQLSDVKFETRYDIHRPFYALLKSNERITAPDWEQDVRHIVFDISNSNIVYENSFKLKYYKAKIIDSCSSEMLSFCFTLLLICIFLCG